MSWRTCACGALMLVTLPATAAWRATTPTALESVSHPRIAAALRATERVDEAILGGDIEAFAAMFTEDAVVNSPGLTVVSREGAVANMRNGLIDYASMERLVEHASLRGEHEVLLMGEEIVTPIRAAPLAGKVVRRRTTELWTNASGEWLLAARQATIHDVADTDVPDDPRAGFVEAKARKDRLYDSRSDCAALMALFSEDVVFWENGQKMDYDFLVDYCPQLPPPRLQTASSDSDRFMLGPGSAYEILVEHLVDPGSDARFIRTTTEIWQEIDAAWKITHMNIGVHAVE